MNSSATTAPAPKRNCLPCFPSEWSTPRNLFASVLLLLVPLGAPGLFGQTEAYTFSTLAGIGGVGGAGTGGSGGGAGFPLFYGPSGVAVGSNGNIFVTDSYNGLIRMVTPTGTVTTLAGTVGRAGAADGTGTAASFNLPSGAAVDSSGNIYIADYGNSVIRKITAAGVVTTLAGQAGVTGSADGTGTAARFLRPTSVAVDTSGNVYVADSGNHVIRKVTSAGVVTTLAGNPTVAGAVDGTGVSAGFNNPRGVAVDGSGNVYVADTGNNAIRKITSAGAVTTLAGLSGTYGSTDGTGSDARFNFPNSVALDSAGNIYVADEINNTIRRVTPSGTVTTLAGSAGTAGSADGTGSAASFHQPTSVAVNQATGDIYVADLGNVMIRKVTSAGVVTTLAGVSGIFGAQDGSGHITNPALFSVPSGTATSAAGYIYVADAGNNMIRQITAGGDVKIVAGSSTVSGLADGTGSSASFRSPTSVATDAAGNIYVADTVNDSIRLITPGGVVTTFAGTGTVAGSADGTGTAARFNNPSGIAVDNISGNIYVADFNNHTIRKITSSGVVSTFAGAAGSPGSADGAGGTARFNYPRGVAVDGSGNVYVADYGNNTIRKISPAGLVSTMAGAAGSAGSADGSGNVARFSGPSGVAVDGAGNVFVTDTNNSTIRLVTSAGVVTTIGGLAGTAADVDGVAGAARFDHPNGISVDSAGNLYVADTRNYTIRKGTTPTSIAKSGGGGSGGGGSSGGTGGSIGTGGTGSLGTSVGAGFFLRPSGIAADSSQILYIADTANNCIKKIATDGTVTVFAGKVGSAGSTDGTGTAALFNGPTGIALDSASNVFVCDTGNATIREITPAGVVTTYAGAAGSRGSQDGTGAAAQFSNPTGIAIDSKGNLYVSDATNCTIRQIASGGVVTTFSGLARNSGEADGIGSAARFNNPTGLTIGQAGDLFVADTYNDTIRQIRTAGIQAVATAAGTITTDGNAKVIVSDAKLAGSPITVSVPVLTNDTPTAWATKVVTALQANTTISASYAFGQNGTSILVTAVASDITDTTLNVALANDTCTGIAEAPTSVAAYCGAVKTLAGSPGLSGAYDGVGSYALFNLPQGVAADANSNVFVADTGNNCIRKISSRGNVVTVAGIAGVAGAIDSTGGIALFNQPQAINLSFAIIVADTGNSLIRFVNSSDATVETLPLKLPATGTTTTTATTATPTTSSYGGGSMEGWFAGIMLTLFGFAARPRRRA